MQNRILFYGFQYKKGCAIAQPFLIQAGYMTLENLNNRANLCKNLIQNFLGTLFLKLVRQLQT
jgi:hypothetical protein